MEAATLNALRPYAFRYAVGVLWVLVAFVVFVTREQLVAFAAVVKQLFTAAGIQAVPEVLLSFSILILGIVVPFCTSLVFQSLSYTVVNMAFTFYSRRDTVAETQDDTDLAIKMSHELSKRAPGGNMVPFTDLVKVMVVAKANPVASEQLLSEYSEVYLRTQTIVPTALLLAAIAWRHVSPSGVAIIVSVCIAVLVLVFGIREAARAGAQWRRNVNYAVLMFGLTAFPEITGKASHSKSSTA